MRRDLIRVSIAPVLFVACLLIVLPSCKGEGPPPPPLKSLGPGAYDVVVIGAGGGGISAAAKLAMGGMKVLVIEQHDKVGGYMTAFERGDYRFELKRAEALLPGLSEHIEVMEVGSPRTMEHYTLNPKGSIFGWEFSKEQSMMKRLPQKTPIKNLYLSGAWAFPGGGQSAVLMGGEMVGRTILGREK